MQMCDSVKYHVTLYMYYVMAWTGMGPDSCTGPNVGPCSVADPMMVRGRWVCNTMRCCGTTAGALGLATETLTLEDISQRTHCTGGKMVSNWRTQHYIEHMAWVRAHPILARVLKRECSPSDNSRSTEHTDFPTGILNRACSTGTGAASIGSLASSRELLTSHVSMRFVPLRKQLLCISSPRKFTCSIVSRCRMKCVAKQGLIPLPCLMVRGRRICNTMGCCIPAAGALGPASNTGTFAIDINPWSTEHTYTGGKLAYSALYQALGTNSFY